MRYGAMNSPVVPLLQEIELIGGLGFDYIEVTMDAPYAHYSEIKARKKQILKALDSFGMQLACHLPTFVSTADITEAIRQASINETIKSMEVAVEIGAIKAVLHPSFIQGLGAMMPDISRKNADASMKQLLDRAENIGLPVCVENLFPNSLSLAAPKDFEDLFRRFPRACMTLDTGHAHIGGGTEKILSFIKRFPDRIGHVHASDNRGRADDHIPVGAGTIDFAEVVKALKEIGYNKTITLEVFSKDRHYLVISRHKLEKMFAEA